MKVDLTLGATLMSPYLSDQLKRNNADKVEFPLGTPIALKEIFKNNPELAKTERSNFDGKRFERVGFAIITQPQTHACINIYGIFYIDKDDLKEQEKSNGKEKKKFIVQDFFEYNKVTKEIIHYSGQKDQPKYKNVTHKKISDFCRKFGKRNGKWGQYGCKPNLQSNNHRCRPGSPCIPEETEFRKALKEKIERIKSSL